MNAYGKKQYYYQDKESLSMGKLCFRFSENCLTENYIRGKSSLSIGD